MKDLFDENRGPLYFEDEELSHSYLQLLQKFELALKLNEHTVLIPSLLPEDTGQDLLSLLPNESLQDVHRDELYQPTIRRFWLSNYIPEGFWPRLICRVYKDQLINSTLALYIGYHESSSQTVDWNTWKKGMVFHARGRTLVYLSLVENQTDDEFLQGKYRIEMSIYVPEMVSNMYEIQDEAELSLLADRNSPSESNAQCDGNPYTVTSHATRLMVAISNHVVSLSTWFNGMVSGDPNGYSPCWKCCGGLDEENGKPPKELMGGVISRNSRTVFSLSTEKCIVPACQGKPLICPAHKELKAIHQTPDLVRIE